MVSKNELISQTLKIKNLESLEILKMTSPKHWYISRAQYTKSLTLSLYISFRVKTVYQNLFFLFLFFVFVILFRVGCEFYYKWVEYPPRRGCYNLTNQIIHGGSGLMPRSELFRRHVKAHVTRLDLAPESTFDLTNRNWPILGLWNVPTL